MNEYVVFSSDDGEIEVSINLQLKEAAAMAATIRWILDSGLVADDTDYYDTYIIYSKIFEAIEPYGTIVNTEEEEVD
jgi:hypothetical protein